MSDKVRKNRAMSISLPSSRSGSESPRRMRDAEKVVSPVCSVPLKKIKTDLVMTAESGQPERPKRKSLQDVVQSASASFEFPKPMEIPSSSFRPNVGQAKETMSKVPDINTEKILSTTAALTRYVLENLTKEQAKVVLAHNQQLQELALRLLVNNAELSGWKEKALEDGTGPGRSRPIVRGNSRSQQPQQEKQPEQQNQQQKARSKSRSTARSKSRPRPPTFSAVVKGLKPMPTSTIKQMVTGSSTTARVKSIRDHKDGGVLIETCSAKELADLIESAKRQDGLVAEQHVVKIPHRVVLVDVSPEVEMRLLVQQLYSKNETENMSYEDFCSSMKVFSAPTETRKTLVLEVDEGVKARWLKQRRVYADWTSYRVRPFVEKTLMSCFRCYGVDHQGHSCKEKGNLCRRCGGNDHLAAVCKNEESCRNCKEKGNPHNHSVTSVSACPIYGKAHLRKNIATLTQNAE